MSLNGLQIRTLVAAQLRLDLRHPRTGETRSSRAVLTFSSYALTSIVLALAMAEQGTSVVELLFVGNSFAAVLAAFAIAGSYDDLMGRPREHAQALLLPVSEQTLYSARMASILSFGGMMALSAALPFAIFAGWHHGAATALVIGGSLVATMLIVSLVVLAGVWLLLLFAPLRVQRPVLSVVRALLIAALVVGYQIVATQSTIVSEAPWWIASWMVGAFAEASLPAILTLALVSTGLVALFTLFFPYRYANLLSRTAAAEGARYGSGAQMAAPNRLERLACVGAVPRAGFGLVASALSADRLVRGRVWPAAMLAVVFGLFGWWSGGLGDLFAYGVSSVLFDPAVQLHLSVLTMLLFASQAAIQGVQVSDHPDAQWVFGTLPLESHRTLQLGAQQAVLFRVLLPVHVVLLLVLMLAMPALHAVLHVGFWFAGCALVSRAHALFQRQPPLTRRSDRFSAGERFLPLLLAVPAALTLLVIQGLTFSSQASALLVIVGMLLLHSAVGQVVRFAAGRPAAQPVAPLDTPAPVPVRG